MADDATPSPTDAPPADPRTALAAAAGDDPALGLRAVRSLRVLADRLESLQVARSRRLGWSWQDIADQLGVTRQAVHKKHGTVLDRGRR